MELSGIDLHYVVQELMLVEGKVEKVYQGEDKHDILFMIYIQGQPKRYVRFVLPGILCMSPEKPSYPKDPPGFAMFLRKYLEGARITGIEQRGSDRLLFIHFRRSTEGKEVRTTLVAEFLHPGNLLLLESEGSAGQSEGNGRIINLMETQQYKDRTLRARQTYLPPPPSFDVLHASVEELIDRIAASTRDSIVTTLAITLGLGGIYAEEVLARAGISKHRNDLSTAEVHAVAQAVHAISRQPIQAHEDKTRAYPFLFQSRPMTPSPESAFSMAIARFAPERKSIVQDVARATVQTKLQRMLDAQRAQVAKFEEEIRSEQRKGERIYEEYALMQELLRIVHEARSKKQDIAEALAGYPQAKKYVPETGMLEIEVEDA
jgi:predicted ribosome quality control (RQC) complex YloA/Tae2 family protein